MRRRLITLLTTISLLLLSVMGPALATKPASDTDDHKVTICHATNSATNPYVVITIDIAAWHEEGGEVGHSPDHHVNQKTGEGDKVWDETDGCDNNGGGSDT